MRSTSARSLILLSVVALAVTACGAGGGSSKSASGPAPTVGAGPGSAVPAPSAVPDRSAGAASGAATAPVAVQAQTIGAAVAPATADIVENGTLAVQLRSAAGLRSSYTAVTGLATGASGFVSASTLTNGRVPSASITLRVPNSALSAVIARIAGMGRVTAQTLSGQDVTGQVVDLTVEITNLTSEETAVRLLLANAGSVRNILTVQQQLFDLQDEIQQLTAQSNSLHNQIQYATLTVHLSAVAPAVVHHRPRHRATPTLDRFWHLARSHTVGVVRGTFLAIGWSAPGLAVLALLGGAWLVWRHRRRVPVTAAAGTTDAS